MSVTATDGAIRTLSPNPIGLPKGLLLREISASITGDVSGGAVDMPINFYPNLGSQNKYAALVSLHVNASTTTDQEVRVALIAADWDMAVGSVGSALTVAAKSTAGSGSDRITARIISKDNAVYLGRAATGGDGTVQVLFPTNVDGIVFQTSGYVLESDNPFVIPAWFSV